jgi:hypothetical protein
VPRLDPGSSREAIDTVPPAKLPGAPGRTPVSRKR